MAKAQKYEIYDITPDSESNGKLLHELSGNKAVRKALKNLKGKLQEQNISEEAKILYMKEIAGAEFKRTLPPTQIEQLIDIQDRINMRKTKMLEYSIAYQNGYNAGSRDAKKKIIEFIESMQTRRPKYIVGQTRWHNVLSFIISRIKNKTFK